MDVKEFYGKASALRANLIQWRRRVHAYPELGLCEKETSLFVQETLNGFGIETQTGFSETGVIGIIRNPGDKTIALRADMDALPIQEKTGAEYQSTRTGIMHACGHDGHIAMLLGASFLLKNATERLKGNVKLIFQPAEEQSFVGRGGARQMILDGVLDNPTVSEIVALHLDPEIPCGRVGIREGTAMAGSTTVEMHVLGKTAHAARPHMGVDAVYLASHVILSLQGMMAHEMNAMEPKIITFGEIRGGSSPNVLASEVVLRGTLRSFSSEKNEALIEAVSNRLKAICNTYGGDALCSFQKLYPPLVNDKRLATIARCVAQEHPGVKFVLDLYTPLLGGEDFAFYAERIPGFMYRLGCGSEQRNFPLHSPEFDFDEDVLVLGSSLLAGLACSLFEVS